MNKFKGLYTALITPFDKQGNLDEQGFRENIQYQLDNQVNGLVVLGTTGESPTLAEQETKRIIEIAREEIKNQTPLIVGTGSYSTKQTVEKTCVAEEFGADGVLVITPYYNKPTQEGLYLHFKEIARSTSLPIILYNHPGRCGNAITIQTMKRLAEIPNIVGVKEITGSIEHLNNLIQAFQIDFPNFAILSGDDNVTFTFLANGAHGVVSVASNLIPNTMKEFIDLCASEDFVSARKLHNQLLPLFNALNIETNPIPIKAVMNLLGFASGACRLPLCDLQQENRDKLEKVLNEMNLSLLNIARIYG